MTIAVSDGMRVPLRLEGLCILAVSALACEKFGSNWAMFAL